MDINNPAYENNSKISDTSISTKDSESKTKQAAEKENSAILIIVAEKEIQPSLSLKIYTNSSLIREKQTKKRTFGQAQEAKETCDKDANKDDKFNITAKIIKITSYEEDESKAERISDKLEEYISSRNVSICENSISFEINFEKWCLKTFNKNVEEFKAGGEKDKQKEKELLKNGNIDQLYDYINSNSLSDKKITEKKKNKRKKKNRNKASKETNNNNPNDNCNSADCVNKDKSEKAKLDGNKENNCFNNINNNSGKKKDCFFSKICDEEVELFKQNIVKDNKKACDIIKIKPIFSTNWLQTLN